MLKQKAILKTDFHLKIHELKKIYEGKVRDVYTFEHKGMIYLLIVVTDRISAFDVVLPIGIAYKGMILNLVASGFLDMLEADNICPTWKISDVHPMITVGEYVEPGKVEWVIRATLTGHAWREYKEGKRTICGVTMPEGMKENDFFPQPILTPTTKASEGHDEDISKEEIIAQGLMTAEDVETCERYTRAIFEYGQKFAEERGLILADTKYEFGKKPDGTIVLIDEANTPDSSRFFILEGFAERQARGEKQRQLSKEFVREWLADNGFQGEEGQTCPEMPEEFANQVTDRYVELMEQTTGQVFERTPYSLKEMEAAIIQYIEGVRATA